MPHYFITATGTDIGKTLVTAALTYQLHAAGKKVKALKPVMSGFDEADPSLSDTAQLLEAQGVAITKETLHATSPWRFAAPLSPDMAAREEQRSLKLNDIVTFCKNQEKQNQIVLVEGVGGVAVPLNAEHLIVDWMAALNYKVILVAGNYLGSMSHILTAVAALNVYNITPHALVISENYENGICTSHMQHSLRPHIADSIAIYILPRITASTQWKAAPDMLGWLV